MKRIVIKKKYIYMLFLLVICLLGFVIVPTFAKFTSNYTTDDDIVGLAFDFDVGISSIEEYEEINVASGQTMRFNVEITNSSSSTAYYGVWYKLVSPSELPEGVTIARLENTETTTSGSINNGETKTVTVVVINSSDDDLKLNIGVASSTTSTNDIEYLGGRKLISGTAINPPESGEDTIPIKLGDYVSLTPTVSSYTTDTTYTGYTSTQTINPQELNLWRVISINDDGTVDIISEHVSSTAVYFRGQTGYLNFVGYLNELASQYENSTYTVGSRHFGYNGQTEYITDTSKFTTTAPWTCSTSFTCSAVESQGGGDELYTTDFSLVNTVLGTRAATNPSGTEKAYWMASRYYGYNSPTYYYWNFYFVYTSGLSGTDHLYDYSSPSFRTYSYSRALRPILTLKSGLKYSGVGTEEFPMEISVS